MFPNNDNQPLPANYLDQIAPQPTRGGGLFGNKKPLFIGLIIAVILTIVITIFGSMKPSSEPTEQLAAKLLSMQTIVEDASEKIKSSKLRAQNTNLDLYLTDMIRDITPLLAASGTDIKKIDKKVTTAEADIAKEATDRLEDARLNAIYDRTYASEMSYMMEVTMALMKKIYDSNAKSDLEEFLVEKYKSLSATQIEFSNFNSTTN